MEIHLLFAAHTSVLRQLSAQHLTKHTSTMLYPNFNHLPHQSRCQHIRVSLRPLLWLHDANGALCKNLVVDSCFCPNQSYDQAVLAQCALMPTCQAVMAKCSLMPTWQAVKAQCPLMPNYACITSTSPCTKVSILCTGLTQLFLLLPFIWLLSAYFCTRLTQLFLSLPFIWLLSAYLCTRLTQLFLLLPFIWLFSGGQTLQTSLLWPPSQAKTLKGARLY